MCIIFFLYTSTPVFYRIFIYMYNSMKFTYIYIWVFEFGMVWLSGQSWELPAFGCLKIWIKSKIFTHAHIPGLENVSVCVCGFLFAKKVFATKVLGIYKSFILIYIYIYIVDVYITRKCLANSGSRTMYTGRYFMGRDGLKFGKALLVSI